MAYSSKRTRRRFAQFSPYLKVPAEVRERGFFEVLQYWLVRTEHMLREDWIPYRVYLLGNYGTDLALKREINRFLIAEDPYGRVDFVRFGLERGELRRDVDVETVVSIIDWVVERFQDALLVEELDPGLFQHHGELAEKKRRADCAVFGRLAKSDWGGSATRRSAGLETSVLSFRGARPTRNLQFSLECEETAHSSPSASLGARPSDEPSRSPALFTSMLMRPHFFLTFSTMARTSALRVTFCVYGGRVATISADEFGHSIGACLILVVINTHSGSLSRHRKRDSAANAAARPCDERHLLFQNHLFLQ